MDWLSSSHETVAGEIPKRSWRTSTDSAIAVVDVTSASYPSLRSSVTSSPVDPSSTEESSSSRTAAQSVQENRSLSAGAQARARSRSVRVASW